MEQPEVRSIPIKALAAGFVGGILLSLLVFLILGIIFDNRSVPFTPVVKTFKLDITTPQENVATNQNLVTISGTVGLDAVVSVASGQETKIVQSHNANFSVQMNLVEGKNSFTITAFNPTTGESQTQKRDLLYLKDELTDLWKNLFF